MTGYDQATSYPSAAQYNYVPNLHGGGPGGDTSLASDPRQLHQWHQYQHQQMQGSPSQRYPYYDRNGYYQHQQQHLDPQSWHEPVAAASAAVSTGATTPGANNRSDSPTSLSQPQHSFPGATPPGAAQSQTQQAGSGGPVQPPPQQSQANVNQYSCKLAPVPPSPPASETAPSQHQYQQYPCPLGGQNQAQQPQQAIYNNNLPQQVHNTYALTSDHGQPSPVGPGSAGGPQNTQQPQQAPSTPQAPLPSPLYPWMRSQFGKDES